MRVRRKMGLATSGVQLGDSQFKGTKGTKGTKGVQLATARSKAGSGQFPPRPIPLLGYVDIYEQCNWMGRFIEKISPIAGYALGLRN